eukprot:1933312-Pleurochrysis_carterae.AAC.1
MPPPPTPPSPARTEIHYSEGDIGLDVALESDLPPSLPPSPPPQPHSRRSRHQQSTAAPAPTLIQTGSLGPVVYFEDEEG